MQIREKTKSRDSSRVQLKKRTRKIEGKERDKD